MDHRRPPRRPLRCCHSATRRAPLRPWAEAGGGVTARGGWGRVRGTGGCTPHRGATGGCRGGGARCSRTAPYRPRRTRVARSVWVWEGRRRTRRPRGRRCARPGRGPPRRRRDTSRRATCVGGCDRGSVAAARERGALFRSAVGWGTWWCVGLSLVAAVLVGRCGVGPCGGTRSTRGAAVCRKTR